MGDWPLPERLLRTIRLPSSGQEVTVRMDGSEYTLASEAEAFVRALPDHPVADYLAREARSMTEAFRRGTHAAIEADTLGSLVFGRLVIETAIRMLWLAAQVDDIDSTRSRLGRLEKRDLSEILRASDAIHKLTGIEPLVANAEELRSSMDTTAKAAPNLRQMAEDSGPVGLYAFYRFLSTSTHPGIGSRTDIARHIGGDEMRVFMRFAYSASVTAIAAVCGALLDDNFMDMLRLNVFMIRSYGNPLTAEPPESPR